MEHLSPPCLLTEVDIERCEPVLSDALVFADGASRGFLWDYIEKGELDESASQC